VQGEVAKIISKGVGGGGGVGGGRHKDGKKGAHWQGVLERERGKKGGEERKPRNKPQMGRMTKGEPTNSVKKKKKTHGHKGI